MPTPYASKQIVSHGQVVQTNNIQMYYEEFGAGKPLCSCTVVAPRIGIPSRRSYPSEQIRQLLAQFNAMHANYGDMKFTAQDLAAIEARTLVVHEDRDNFFPVEIPESMCRAIPEAELWIIPGGDHVPIFDPRVPFTERALRFLAGTDRH